MNDYLDLNRLVLGAKIGNKNDFMFLWKIYGFLIDDIFLSFCKVYKFLEPIKPEIFRDFYIYFWDAIKDYDFEGCWGFSYFLKIYIIKRMLKKIKREYRLDESKVISVEAVKSLITSKDSVDFKKNDMDRYHSFIKSLSGNQKKVFILSKYDNKTLEEIGVLLGISKDAVIKRMDYVNKKIRNSYRGIRKRKRDAYFYEYKAYKMYYVGKNGDK